MYILWSKTEKKWLPDSIHSQECLTINTARLAVHTTQNIHTLQNQYTEEILQIVTITSRSVKSFQ